MCYIDPFEVTGIELVSTSHIENYVCQQFNTTFDRINNRSRNKEIMIVRQIIMTMYRHFTDLSLREIGLIFNKNFDHCSVFHNVKTINNLRQFDKQLDNKIIKIEEYLSLYFNS